MTPQILTFSFLNAIKMHHQYVNFAIDDIDNTYLQPIDLLQDGFGADESFFAHNIKDWQTPTTYCSPWQKSDLPILQFTAEDTIDLSTFTFRLLDREGRVIKTYTPNSTSGFSAGNQLVWNTSLDFINVEDGTYFLQLKCASLSFCNNNDLYFISEPLDVKERQENTILYKYRNTHNDQLVFWNVENIVMQARIESAFEYYDTKTKVFSYENQPLNMTILEAIPHRVHRLVFGHENNRLPDYRIDFVERLFGCDTIQINKSFFARNGDANTTYVREKNHPKSQASIEVRESINHVAYSFGETLYYKVGKLPETESFYITAITNNTNATIVSINKYFKTKESFLGYCNKELINGFANNLTTYFKIDTQNNLYVCTTIPNGLNGWITNQLKLYGILPYCVEMTVIKNSGFDLIVSGKFGVVAKYSIITDNTTTTTTTVIPVVATININSLTTKDTTVIICLNYCAGFKIITPNTLLEIGGNLAPQIQVFEIINSELTHFKNNIFSQNNGALIKINVISKLNTHEVNRLIMYLADLLQVTTASIGSINTSGQINSAPPSGVTNLIYLIRKFGWSVFTD
jgi:hypothetical protein